MRISFIFANIPTTFSTRRNEEKQSAETCSGNVGEITRRATRAKSTWRSSGKHLVTRKTVFKIPARCYQDTAIFDGRLFAPFVLERKNEKLKKLRDCLSCNVKKTGRKKWDYKARFAKSQVRESGETQFQWKRRNTILAINRRTHRVGFNFRNSLSRSFITGILKRNFSI